MIWNNPSKSFHIKIFLFLGKLNYVNLNLVKFQLQSISQQKYIENGSLLPISNGIFSSQNVPNFKPLVLGFDISLNYGTKKIWNISSFLNFVKYFTMIKFYETIPIATTKKGHQRSTLQGRSKKTLTFTFFITQLQKHVQSFSLTKLGFSISSDDIVIFNPSLHNVQKWSDTL